MDERELKAYMDGEVAGAMRERERCAKLVECMKGQTDIMDFCRFLQATADLIRRPPPKA